MTAAVSDNTKLREMEEEHPDVSVGISPNLYDRSFDELITEYAPIAQEEATHINWYAVSPIKSTALIRYLSRNLSDSSEKISFNAITQTALLHGFAIFKHRYTEIIELVETLDDDAIESGNDRYFDFEHRIIRPATCKRIQTRTDRISSEAIGQLSATLSCSKAHLTGICILLSLVTSMTIPAKSRQMIQKQIDDFDTHMALKKNYILSLINTVKSN
jgi:hypothetical protein